MDVVKELRKAYVTLISNQGYTVYDRFLPSNIITGLYFILRDQDDQRQLDKCGNGHISSIVINVVYRNEDHGSGVEADNAAEIIIPLIESDSLVLPAGLTLIKGSSTKVSDTTDSGVDNIFNVYMRVLRFQHIIKEN